MASGSLYKAPIPSCALVSLSGPGGHQGSNSAACVTGIFAFHGNRQVLIPWSESFACLSSYGISNDLDGFFVHHLKVRFQTFSLLVFRSCLPCRIHLPSSSEFINDRDRNSSFEKPPPFWPFWPRLLAGLKNMSNLAPEPPLRALLAKSSAADTAEFIFSYWTPYKQSSGHSLER